MSERGSFCTEWIYTDQDRKIVYDYLINLDNANVTLNVITNGPVVAGTIRCGVGYPGQEVDEMEFNILPDLCKLLNDNMRFVVLCDSGCEAVIDCHAKDGCEVIERIKRRPYKNNLSDNPTP